MKKFLGLAVTLILAGCISNPYVSLYGEDAALKSSQGIPLMIYNAAPGAPNSAGGVDVRLGIANLSEKPIKYLRATVVPYNAVGDRVSGTIRRRSAAGIYATGPFAAFERSKAPVFEPLFWENIWYNYSITCIQLTRVSIEYMDGTTRTFSNLSSIRNLLHPSVSNNCRV
jgi:hypothetical protein